jgi:transposase
MADNVNNNVETKPIGFAPILLHYFQKCGIADIIDQNVPLDARRKVLTHGQASIAMITGILFQVMSLYRVSQFAEETNVLDVIFPDISPDEYFDDRLGDTLDAIYKYGIGNLELLITRNIIEVFKIQTEICHNDTTCAQVYGEHNKNRSEQSINISYGYSKQYRKDLKQLVWSMTASSDSSFPLFQQAYSGNTADVETYVEQWHHLIDLLGKKDFLFAGDSKVATHGNMAHIDDHGGYFLSPLPMYASYQKTLFDALDKHDHEVLIPYKDQMNRGFEVPLTFEHKNKSYTFRMIILFDHGLFHRRKKSLLERITDTQAAFDELAKKINAYKLKTKDSIEDACQAILKKHKTQGFFEFVVQNDPVVTYKNARPGRPAKNAEKVEVRQDHFSIEINYDETAYTKALYRIGYYPLVTNKSASDFSIEDAMLAHKNQYKVEHLYRRSKSGYKLEPIYLQTPDRIEAYLFLFKTTLQILILMERTARTKISERDKGLDNFMPNKKDVRNPGTEYMLAMFGFIVCGIITLSDGSKQPFVSKLTETQKDILSVLDVPEECYTYQYLFDTS